MNLIAALCNLSECRDFRLEKIDQIVPNTVSSKGRPLEVFVRSIFCGIPGSAGTFADPERVFSYMGGKNHPPDAMIRGGGDAIEIKKVEREMGAVFLNSSLPKTKLYLGDKVITKEARTCEPWESRDMLYVVGYVQGSSVKSLFFVYGDCFAKHNSFYCDIFSKIKSKVAEISGVSAMSNEYGFINDADGLGNGMRMRIRPINSFDSPWKIFGKHVEYDRSSDFAYAAIMRREKYDSFPEGWRKKIESAAPLDDIAIRDPESPGDTLKAVVIRKEIRL